MRYYAEINHDIAHGKPMQPSATDQLTFEELIRFTLRTPAVLQSVSGWQRINRETSRSKTSSRAELSPPYHLPQEGLLARLSFGELTVYWRLGDDYITIPSSFWPTPAGVSLLNTGGGCPIEPWEFYSREPRIHGEELMVKDPSHLIEAKKPFQVCSTSAHLGRELVKDKGGRPTKWDWDGARHEMQRCYDPKAGKLARRNLTRHIQNWFFDKNGAEPADSSLRAEIRKFLASINDSKQGC
ncbi:hypothetical protein [Methylobacterium nigriterrae]|uniref:hypothetical protein n=1 Tax=Methylobacterium nigriterrae TaxID=3127512 RepID=UPI00301410B9